MVSFEWSKDLWAPLVISVLVTGLGAVISWRIANQTATTQSRLAIEQLRREQELEALDPLLDAILRVRDAVSKESSLLGDPTSSLSEGVEGVRDAFFRFTATAESLHMALRPEVRSVVVPFAQSTEWIGRLKSETEMFELVRNGGGDP